MVKVARQAIKAHNAMRAIKSFSGATGYETAVRQHYSDMIV